MAKNVALEAGRITPIYDRRHSPRLTIEPLSDALPRWSTLLATTSGASLYHREPWLKALQRAYGLRLFVATIARGRDVLAGCVLAQSGGLPLRSRMVSLPFSDYCPPLGVDDDAKSLLRDALAEHPPASRLEIRGVEPGAPWVAQHCFQRWVIDLSKPLPFLKQRTSKTFRYEARRAAASGVQIEKGSSSQHVRRFYRLQLETRRRLGLPPQPLGFFAAVREEFAGNGGIELWFAVAGDRDLAAIFLLRDGDDLYCKWAARRTPGTLGANHLLNIALIEEYAGRAKLLDLGRVDMRNAGLVHFKKALGAKPFALPYAYFPKAPDSSNSEAMGPLMQTASRLWRHLPVPVTRVVGASIYRYFA